MKSTQKNKNKKKQKNKKTKKKKKDMYLPYLCKLFRA